MHTDTKDIMLSDKSQSQKDPYCMIPFMKHLRYGTALWLPEVRNRGEGDGYNYKEIKKKNYKEMT